MLHKYKLNYYIIFYLKINSKKTFLSEEIILDCIKADKLYWTTKKTSLFEYITSFVRENGKIKLTKKRYYKLTLQKHLIEIKILGDKFPNCGQLMNALSEFYDNRISILDPKQNQLADVNQLISIIK